MLSIRSFAIKKTYKFLQWIYYTYLRSKGVIIGKNTMISFSAKVDTRRGRVLIGSKCVITHGCVILSHDYAAELLGNKISEFDTVINDGVFVGVNSVVLPGVIIGEKAIVGAGSVVTKDVPPYSLVVGNPARIIKRIER